MQSFTQIILTLSFGQNGQILHRNLKCFMFNVSEFSMLILYALIFYVLMVDILMFYVLMFSILMFYVPCSTVLSSYLLWSNVLIFCVPTFNVLIFYVLLFFILMCYPQAFYLLRYMISFYVLTLCILILSALRSTVVCTMLSLI